MMSDPLVTANLQSGWINKEAEHLRRPENHGKAPGNEPKEHFSRYQTLMNMVTFSEEVLCRSFLTTLYGLASEWFNDLPKGKIDLWEDLAAIAANCKKKLHFSHLFSVRKRPDEPLKEFLSKWKLEATMGKQRVEEAPPKRKEIGLPSDDEEAPPKHKRVEENRMIYRGDIKGDSSEQRKKWVHSACVRDVSNTPKTSKLTIEGANLFGFQGRARSPFPHRDALVIKCEINDIVIHRYYVDSGSSVNITYIKTFEDLALKMEILFKVRTLLSRFTWEIIDAEVLVEVIVTFGDRNHKRMILVEFMVVRLISVSPMAVSIILLREEGETQGPVYYVSRTLQDAKFRYPVVEKTILAVVIVVNKLNHYFQAHEVEVRGHQPLGVILQNPTPSNRVIKWSLYLRQYQIEIKLRMAIKGQAVGDFMVECTARDNNPKPTMEQREWWTLLIDGPSAVKASGGSVVLQSPEGFCS
ncbi:unnamed protein product [Cuscuta campestris]|uniref:Reverse transcriptase RNase H-like domain-containing protein n=1 Tax=Cuscuta campestris TaxID=132261 RepID=A0A484KVA7_9ASTE|nr:unnamed protein product [Cuscuta campestris]